MVADPTGWNFTLGNIRPIWQNKRGFIKKDHHLVTQVIMTLFVGQPLEKPVGLVIMCQAFK